MPIPQKDPSTSISNNIKTNSNTENSKESNKPKPKPSKPMPQAKGTNKISHSGKPQNLENPPGILHGAKADQDGTSNAQPWPIAF